MKTIQELVKEIEGSEDLKNELKEIKDKVSFEAFLKKHECDATAEDIASFAKEMKEGEIGDDEVAAVAGGSFMDRLMGFLEDCTRAMYEPW